MQRLVRFWLEYAHRYRWVYLVGLICLVATNALTVAIPDFVRRAIDGLAEGRPVDDAIVWCLAILAAGVAVIIVRTLSRTLFFNPGRTIEFRVKNTLFDRLLVLPRIYFDAEKPGDLISRGTNDTNSVRSLAGFAMLQLLNVVLQLVLTVGRMLTMDVTLTLMCVLPLVAAAFILRYAITEMFRLVVEMQSQLGVLSNRILESFNGVNVLQAYNAVPGVRARFEDANDRLLDIGLGLTRIRSFMMPLVMVTGNLCLVVLLYVGGGRVIEGTLTLGELTAFSVYINILAMSLTFSGFAVNALQRGIAGLDRVYDVIEAEVERPDASAEVPQVGVGGHALEIRGLAHHWPDAKEPALADVSFDVRAGETLGIFGETGSGKTTLLNLLARVYEPPEGSVRLDGVDVRALPIRDYWQDVAYVPQEPHLFSQSIRENIAISTPADDVDPAAVDSAVVDAALAPDLEALPEGLETRVGERGITLSGGQRQRVSLARAFYRDFQLLLLDDVMSAVDHATEKHLIDSVYRRNRGCTTVIVSHRISVLSRADRIIVLDEGRLVESGTHEQLLTGTGPYAHAWKLQQAAEALEAADGDPPARPGVH